MYVPSNQDTPFLTIKDGVVYTRSHSSSAPVNDRYVLESLIERGRRHSKEIEAFCEDDRIVLSEERYQNKSWLNIYIIPYPLKDIGDSSLVSREKAFELLKRSKERPNITADFSKQPYLQNERDLWEFDSVRSTHDSIVFSKLWKAEYEDLPRKTLDEAEVVEIFVDGKSKFHIPLLEIKQEEVPRYVKEMTGFLGSGNRVLELLEGYKQRKDSGEDVESPVPHFYFFDFLRVCWHVLSLLMFYKENIGEHLDIDSVRMVIKITIGSDHYYVPLWFDKEWIEITNKMGIGLPMVRGGVASFAGNEKGILLEVADFSNKEWQEAFKNLLGLIFGLMIRDEEVKRVFEVIIEQV